MPVLTIHVTNITGSLETECFILSAYAIAQLLLRIPIGLLADRVGNKKLSLFAILLSSLGSILLMISDNANSLFLSRTLTGLAAAGWVPISILYSSYFTSENTDKSNESDYYLYFKGNKMIHYLYLFQTNLMKMKIQSKNCGVDLQILKLRIMILKIQALSGHILLI